MLFFCTNWCILCCSLLVVDKLCLNWQAETETLTNRLTSPFFLQHFAVLVLFSTKLWTKWYQLVYVAMLAIPRFQRSTSYIPMWLTMCSYQQQAIHILKFYIPNHRNSGKEVKHFSLSYHLSRAHPTGHFPTSLHILSSHHARDINNIG